jgi:hypothetical protein
MTGRSRGFGFVEMAYSRRGRQRQLNNLTERILAVAI